MNGTIILIAALVLLAALTVVFVIALNNVKKDKESAVALVRESYERTMTEMKSGHEKAVADLKEGHSKAVLDMKSSHEAAISELKKSHDEAMGKQMEMLKAQMIAESEKVLKAREEELDKRAKATFENIAGGLDKDIKDMKEAFEQNKKTHTETSQALKVNIEAAVKNLREQTMSIGDKADSLAEALRGKNKAQGNWGEVILDNLFTAEGLREGRDYDKEETLRDEAGNVILNEDTSKKMRPDFILHYPNGNDIVIDSKVVLTAMYDYYAAAYADEVEYYEMIGEDPSALIGSGEKEYVYDKLKFDFALIDHSLALGRSMTPYYHSSYYESVKSTLKGIKGDPERFDAMLRMQGFTSLNSYYYAMVVSDFYVQFAREYVDDVTSEEIEKFYALLGER